MIQSKGGRFLKRDAANTWVEVPDKRAQEKTSQALREGLDVRNNKIRPSKMTKSSVRSSSMSSQRHVTGIVVSPNSPNAVAIANNATKRNPNLEIPTLKEEESQPPLALLYQPSSATQTEVEKTCEV
jgi:hypothetical protein